ncbi:N-acetyltransferase [Pengzhenrongella sp.]|jgi:GNAT superfamily N-acetyltransferase|uniref:N-acetyltransferase n=1 Tax=Pengzhenrongella sp. TaxID=2888820 RepID=UPI002F923E49
MRTEVGTTAWRILPVPVPSSLDDDDAWALHAVAALERATQEAAWGHHDLAYPAQANLVKLQDARYTRRVQLVAVPADRPRDVLGAAIMRLFQRSNTHLVEVDVLVRPDQVGRGVDDALLDAALDHARADGRRVAILSSEHTREPAPDDPGVLVAPTGSGRIQRTDPGATLAERFGFTLEQADRYSVLELPVAPERLAELRSSAAAVAGAEYRTVTWVDRCPEEWVEEFARLETRMTTDAPSAGLEIDEDPWDAARVRASEASIAQAGRDSLVTAVVHEPSHTLAGFTMVELPRATPEVVYQENTLVVREHRGKRLGMLVKAVNLEQLAARFPGARRVHTWNAEENSFMLNINVALGFRPVGVYAMWQKHLD